jgi:hypothetical protein
VLKARYDAAPSPSDFPKSAAIEHPIDGHLALRAKGVPDGTTSLAEALSALASPQGRLPILIGWDRERLNAVTGIETKPDQEMDAEWLTVLAAVRPQLARLEAVQLAGDPLESWSSSPGDPWQQAAVAANSLARRTKPIEEIGVPRLFAAYGPSGAISTPRIAVGIVDAFGEAVPMRERDTHAAFGFNAPAARAPQAILLAVPPSDGRRLDDDLLHRILTETRELMVARTATIDNLGTFDWVMRTVWLPDSTPDGLLGSPSFLNL